MTIRSFTRTLNAQASVLLVYCLCLFIIGMGQISLGIALRLLYNLQLHVYCYPDWSGSLTLLPFLIGILYYIFKSKCLTILLSITSFMSFIGAIGFTGILLVETHLYDLVRFKLHELKQNNGTATFFVHDERVLKFDLNDKNVTGTEAYNNDKWFFILVLVIFGLSLLQAFLSIIGMVLSFVWSPCCQNSYTSLSYGIDTTLSNGRKTININDNCNNNVPNASTMLLKMKHFDEC